MARRNQNDPEDFPAPPPGNAFANVPMPPPEVVAQMAATLPQVEPEALLVAPHDPLAVAMRGNYSGKSMKHLIDEFVAAVSSHPDGKLLTSSFGGTPTEQQKFGDTPLRNQHRVEIRLLYREATPAAVFQANEQAAAEKPWKWAPLCVPATKPTGRVAEATDNSGRPWTYEHLVKQPKRETAAV